ncbi:AbrB family transcriptional regulator [Roseibium denhamense]|uniref:AbrB family transcriptional regulator n=1 Tax=Roseibium denhamense TaxID=76305 RepID=A0ABY1PJ69_9HYPH|nr:AbrB family transcriptional regulator [Roseibium denhamense]MTI05854.1 AbrB family transcriptional regulator [Roseibium denhamense]SMP35489.1 hypothetical protein SAMN06265374_4029 [Roseibium denhamense]
MNKPLQTTAITLAAGLLGAAIAALFGVPAGALIGSTLGVAVLATTGVQTGLPTRLRDFAFATIGISLGSGIDERLFEQLGAWGISLTILVVSLVVTVVTGRFFLMRVFGLDAETATLASAPGTMSNAIAIASEGRGDATAVMFLQVMRLLALVVLVPPLAITLDSPVIGAGQAADVISLPVLAALVVLAVVAGMAGTRLGLPAASLLAGMVLSAGGHAIGIVQGASPGWLIFVAFAATGSVLGARMSRITLKQVRKYAVAGLATVGTAIVVSLAFAVIAQSVTGLPFGQIWIAYAPGGVEAMAAIGLALGHDPAYVAVHHFARIFALILIVPAVLRF